MIHFIISVHLSGHIAKVDECLISTEKECVTSVQSFPQAGWYYSSIRFQQDSKCEFLIVIASCENEALTEAWHI